MSDIEFSQESNNESPIKEYDDKINFKQEINENGEENEINCDNKNDLKTENKDNNLDALRRK
jgi:hypothetical protein